MKITVLCVGKIKEKFYIQALDEYIKRLSRYVKLEIIQVADEKTPDGAGDALNAQILTTEGERLLKKLPEDAHVITLEIGGRKLSSEAFAANIDTLMVKGVSHIAFVIGGSLGLGENMRRKSDFALSFSDMTFPHQLMRVILLEQIYRAFRINANEPYHK